MKKESNKKETTKGSLKTYVAQLELSLIQKIRVIEILSMSPTHKDTNIFTYINTSLITFSFQNLLGTHTIQITQTGRGGGNHLFSVMLLLLLLVVAVVDHCYDQQI